MPAPQTECIVVARRGLGQDRAAVDSSTGATTLVLADEAGGRAGGREAAELCTATAMERMHLIASDGLLKFAAPATICGIVRSATDLAAAGRALIDSVRLRTGDLQDDTSLILLRFPA